MVNYHNPVTIEREYSAYAFLPSIGGNRAIQPNLLVYPSTAALVNLWHVVDGIYM